MATPRTLGVPVDHSVSPQLHFDIQNVKIQDKKILVVGGGDSAAEYSKILCDRGHEVILSYRGLDFSRMIEKNAFHTRELVANKKMHYLPESQVEKIEELNNFPLVYFKENKYPEISVSAVVIALGTERPTNYLNSIGINTEMESGEFFAESKMMGLFFVGDLASGKGGGSINFAFNSGVKALTEACDMYLDCSIPAYKKNVS